MPSAIATPADRIHALTGIQVDAACAALLTCAECGELLWRSQAFWGCPRLHGRLIPPALLARALSDVARARFTRPRGAKRFLARFQAAQVRAIRRGRIHPLY